MSSTARSAHAPTAAPGAGSSAVDRVGDAGEAGRAPEVPGSDEALGALRAELDRLDDVLHDTLMRRAEVVGQVAHLKGGVALRPGREAAIIRRLLARHAGELPRVTVERIWRELLGATTAMQRPLRIAVCDTVDGNGPFAAAAREHFGALVPQRVHRTPAQALRDVSAGVAAAAVLPLPAQEEPPAAAWWTALLQRDDPRIHVVAKLPFWAPRPPGSPPAQAYVASVVPPDPSGADRSLIGLELGLDTSRARVGTVLAAAGLAVVDLILRRDPGVGTACALAEVDGFVRESDPRLAALGAVSRPPVVLGAYAIPIEDP